MIRDEHLRNVRAEGGKKGGNPSLKAGKVNLKDNPKVGEKDKQKPTPSSSSSSSSSLTEREISRGEIPGTVRGAPCTESQAKTRAASVGVPEALGEEWFCARSRDGWERSDHCGTVRAITQSNWQADLTVWCRQVNSTRQKNGNNGKSSAAGRGRVNRNVGTCNTGSEYAHITNWPPRPDTPGDSQGEAGS
jgi:hypothetical protein